MRYTAHVLLGAVLFFLCQSCTTDQPTTDPVEASTVNPDLAESSASKLEEKKLTGVKEIVVPKVEEVPEPTKTSPVPEKEKVKPSAEEAKPKSSSRAIITFEKTVHEFGSIAQGEGVTHQFVFKNTGNKDLVISNATATCGCTQPSFPFIPIPPGEEGYIGVTYNSTGKLGAQRPVVTVTTNAKPRIHKIYLEGTVIAAETTTLDN